MKLISTKIWIFILSPIWSLIINTIILLKNINRLDYLLITKKSLENLTITELISKIEWTPDKFKDWISTIFTLIINNYKDDCDGAANLAKFWYKKNNIEARLVFIYNEDLRKGHCICVRDDNTEFVSNNEVIKLNPNNWKEDIFSKFDDEYSIMIERTFKGMFK